MHIGEKVEIPVNIDHAGPNIVEIEAEPAPGELTTVNNRAVLTVEGVRENLRVLLVSGEPHAGERTWRNMLKSDASVDLVHFTILRPPEKQDGTPINQLSLIAFPTRELFQEKLDQFDLIIFDRYQRRGVLPLLYLENVAHYVERGGAVLVSAGDDYASPLSLYRSPLGQVLPAVPNGRVVEEPFKAEAHRARREASRDRRSAWAHAGRRALLGTLVPRGRCRAARRRGADEGRRRQASARDRRARQGPRGAAAVGPCWLWARGYEGGGPYTDLLRRLAHWLMKEPDLEEETLKATSRGQTLTIERRTIKDAIDPVTVTAPSGKEETDHSRQGRARPMAESHDRRRAGRLPRRLRQARQRRDRGQRQRQGAVRRGRDRQAALAPARARPAAAASGSGERRTRRPSLPRIVMMRSGHVMHGEDWLGLHQRDAYHVKGVRLFPLFTGFLALASCSA